MGLSPSLLLALALPTASDSAAGSVPLMVLDAPADMPWVLSGGVPFAQGVVRNEPSWQVVDERDQPLRAVVEVTNQWPADQSLRWLLVHVALPGGNPSPRLLLRPGKSIEPADGVRVSDDGVTLRIDNGLLRFVARRGVFAPLEQLAWHDGGSWRPVLRGLDLYVQDWYPKTHCPRIEPPAHVMDVTLERHDALCAVVRYRGGLYSAFTQDCTRLGFDLRLVVTYRSPVVRLLVTLVNTSPDEVQALREIGLGLVGEASAAHVWLGGEEDVWSQALDSQQALRLIQTGPTHFQPWEPFSYAVRDPSGAVLARGGKAPGWMALDCGAVRTTVAVRDFWEKHALGLSAAPDGGRVLLWPRDAVPLVWPSGAAVTHDLLLAFGPVTDRAQQVAQRLAETLRRPPRLVTTPEQYCASGVFGPLSPAVLGPVDYDVLLRQGLDALWQTRVRDAYYGLLDYGDFTFARDSDEWTNLEYDLPHGCVLQFARTGDRAWLDEAEVGNRHRRDVDVVHWHEDPSLIGVNCKHHVGHTGRREGRTGFPRGLFCHSWTQSFWDLYFLTGDVRSREVAVLATEAMYRRTAQPLVDRSEREYGWPMMIFQEAWYATGDTRYRDRLLRLFRDVLPQQAPDGNMGKRFTCEDGTVRTGSKAFMLGILLEGLYRAWQIEPDPAMAQFAVRAADWLVREVWEERDGGFRYTPCEGPGRAEDQRELVGLYWAYELTGDRRYLDVARRNLRAGIDSRRADGPAGASKELGILLRATPHFVALCHQAGIVLE